MPELTITVTATCATEADAVNLLALIDAEVDHAWWGQPDLSGETEARIASATIDGQEQRR
jgi:hypothetical protein